MPPRFLANLTRRIPLLLMAAMVGHRPLGAQDAAPPRYSTTASPCTEPQRVAGCLIILGSGVPVPDPDRAGPAYGLLIGDRTFLFDAGAGVMRRVAAAGLPINGFTAAFLTHLHSDHTLGLPDVLFTTWTMGRRGPFPLIGPPGTDAMVAHLLRAWEEDIAVRITGLEQGQPAGPGVTVHESRGGVVYDSGRCPHHRHPSPPQRAAALVCVPDRAADPHHRPLG